MRHYRLDDMTGGWFVGPFQPTVLDIPDTEVAVKSYSAGAREPRHVHKIATEITVVVSGTVNMVGRDWTAGDIIVLSPGESTDFHAITDAVNVVVKVPAVIGDKYLVADDEALD